MTFSTIHSKKSSHEDNVLALRKAVQLVVKKSWNNHSWKPQFSIKLHLTQRDISPFQVFIYPENFSFSIATKYLSLSPRFSIKPDWCVCNTWEENIIFRQLSGNVQENRKMWNAPDMRESSMCYLCSVDEMWEKYWANKHP